MGMQGVTGRIFLFFSLVSILIAVVLFTGCNSSGGGGSLPSSGFTTIGELPRATSPVEGSGISADSSKALKAMGANFANSGVPIGSLGPDTFGPDSSRAMCEMSQVFRDGLGEAAQGDRIFCFVQNIFEFNQNNGNGSEDFDLYDGEWHVIGLSFISQGENGDDGGPFKVRMKVTKAENGSINDFFMFACGDHAASEDTQTEYLRQTINGNSFSMISKGFFSGNDDRGPEGEGSAGLMVWSHQVEVTGTLNDNGRFTGTKTIQMAYSGSGQHSNSGRATLLQTSDTISFSGFHSGTWSFEGNSGTFAGQIVAMSQLIDPNVVGQAYNIGLLSIGDGAARGRFSGQDQFGNWIDDHTEGWNGDTTLPDSVVSEPYLEAIANEPLPSIEPVNITFEGDEIYNCDEPPEHIVEVDMFSLEEQCADLLLFHGEWINCHEIIGGGGG